MTHLEWEGAANLNGPSVYGAKWEVAGASMEMGIMLFAWTILFLLGAGLGYIVGIGLNKVTGKDVSKRWPALGSGVAYVAYGVWSNGGFIVQ